LQMCDTKSLEQPLCLLHRKQPDVLSSVFDTVGESFESRSAGEKV